ncbi:MAG: GNAT family N-acetyltransferase [Oscillospiraceae bacterium]|jgi:GNAT superfamily N-acetyltransferase|nr:GNAT family N-acetyltransferase [Oscillospiraceae bacterium]
MQIRKAVMQDADTVLYLTQTTIRAVYPHYYPAGAVEFFSRHHSPAAIAADIAAGIVWLLTADDGRPAGTVTVRNNEILRLFVLPDDQGNGYGGALLRYAEQVVAASYETAVLDVSLAAKAIYRTHGYTEKDYAVIRTENGDFLCYDIMEKPLRGTGGTAHDT